MQDRVGLLAVDHAGRERPEDRRAYAALLGPARDARDELERLDAERRCLDRLVAALAAPERVPTMTSGRSACAIDARRSP